MREPDGMAAMMDVSGGDDGRVGVERGLLPHDYCCAVDEIDEVPGAVFRYSRPHVSLGPSMALVSERPGDVAGMVELVRRSLFLLVGEEDIHPADEEETGFDQEHNLGRDCL